MKRYFVYILKCSDNSYYTVMTNDLERRIHEHILGIDKKCYTYSRRPTKLEFSEEYTDTLTAIEKEKQIKRWSRKKKAALIAADFDELVALSTSASNTSI